jgi:hypothetical protein
MTIPDRHPATMQLLGFFGYDHLPPHLQAISAPCHDLAFDMATTLPDSPELTVGLRKLLEAKDAFVRQAQLVYRLARDAEVAADARAAGKGA